jgi:hypothetical protein
MIHDIVSSEWAVHSPITVRLESMCAYVVCPSLGLACYAVIA